MLDKMIVFVMSMWIILMGWLVFAALVEMLCK